MPRIIREILNERVRRYAPLPAWVADCASVAGLPVAFVPAAEIEVGAGAAAVADEAEALPGLGPLCVRLQKEAAGCRLCARFRRGLCEAAATEPVTRRCEAGLWELAVPVRAAGVTLGHLVVIGAATEPGGPVQANRARHLLARAGVTLGETELTRLLTGSPLVMPKRLAALGRMLRLVAERLAREIGEVGLEKSPLVEQACRIVQVEYRGPLSLGDLATRLGVSEGHLSREFHHAAGVRFVDYLARFRVERARAMLLTTETPVGEIARGCGFASLSQFNRVFRAAYATSPREARRLNRLAAVDSRP